MIRHNNMGRWVMALLLLAVVCVGTYADDDGPYVTVTWPFSSGSSETILTDYSFDNIGYEAYGTHKFKKYDDDHLPDDILLVTEGSPYTAISEGLTIGGTQDISSYISGSETNTTFTKITGNGSGTIDLVITPNYEGYSLLAQNISFEAFKSSGSSGSITITAKVKWLSGTLNSVGTALTLSAIPTTSETLSESDYKWYYSWPEDKSSSNDWYFENTSDYYISKGEISQLELSIAGLTASDEIYIGNVTMTYKAIETDTVYQTEYNENLVNNVEIKHKAAKWYQQNIREQSDYDFVDTFDDENKMDTLENDAEVQATHIYVDTIYMKKGTSIDLVIPSVKYDGSSCAINNYFRWFNYRNDKNFHCGGDVIGSDTRTDLLIPVKVSDYDITAWRFANGYVSGLLAKRPSSGTTDINGNTEDSQSQTLRKVSFYYPTDDEFKILSSLDNFKGKNDASIDNKYYAVACDLSNYTDFSNDTYTANAGGNDFGLTDDATSDDTTKPQIYCEPTLMQRVLFYIIGIDESTSKSDLPEDFTQYGELFNNSAYHDGGNGEGKKYLEEYEITFPSKRISDYTDELVALSKDAQSYALPGESNPLTDNLDITFADGENNGLTLKQSTLSGANRVIQFFKGTSGSQWSVANNSKVTILVTKTVGDGAAAITYNIARYKLTFKDACVPLTEPQIAVLDTLTDNSQYWWGNMKYRSKSYLNENYDLVNSLWFDYGTYTDSYNTHAIFNEAAKTAASNQRGYPGQYQNYPFPLKWSNSSYAFYDGSYDVNYYNSSHPTPPGGTDTYRNQTSFCMYEIVNDYVGFGELNGGISPKMPQYSTVRNSGGSWLYIDASDRPGTVAELELNEKLCQGSEVIATAWMKSSGYTSSSGPEDDAAVMFTIMGVRNENGKETHTPIYRQYSGQIRTTNLLNTSNDNTIEGESGLDASITGKGSDTNEWFQLYMSFVNTEDVDYDYYTVRIDNCCASTNGGDYYLDEISVYVVQPTVEVAQIQPVCTSDDTKGYAPIRLDIDYESLMGCFGLDSSDYNSEVEESDDDGGGQNQVSKRRVEELDSNPEDTDVNDSIKSIDFIIINKYKYENYLATEDATSVNAVKKAIENSIDTLYYTVKTTSTDDGNEVETDSIVGTAYPTLNFYLTYLKNVEYNEETTGENYPVDSLIYRRTDSSSGLELLAADFYSDISAYTPYMIVLRLSSSDDETDEQKLDAFATLLATSYKCAVKSDFYVTSTTKIRVNGEVSDPSETLCKNQVVHIEPQGTYTTTETNEDGEEVEVTHTIEGEYFDWFEGLVEEYVAENEDYGGESLESALSSYRLIYPNESSLASEYSTYENDTLNVDGSDDNNIQFTENQYDLLQSYLVSGKLALYRQYLDVHVSDSGLVLVIQPIQISDYEVEDENTMRCFGYVPLVLMIDGQSPSLNMGFSDVSYPSDFTPALRLGQDQLKKATKAAESEDDAYTPITVNLRDASYVVEETEDDGEEGDEQEGEDSEDEEEQQVVDHLGRIDDIAEGDSINYAKLYLVGTNDTDYVRIIEADNFGTYELEVGEIKRLFAHEDISVSDTYDNVPDDVKDIGSYMQVYFYDHFGDSIEGKEFVPKEGCYYSMTVHFEEKDADDETIPSPCYGSFPLILKVVPEYLVWQGTEGTENWNDDNNWRRADKSELNKSDDDEYLTNKANKGNGGYVPMLFSKVVLPKDSKAELYMAGFAEESSDVAEIDDDTEDPTTSTKWVWTKEDEKPTNIYPIEDNIMYDMMVYNESCGEGEDATTLLTTKRYRVNLCDEIHFEPGAQLLHAEQLMYNKAWIDVRIPKSQWTLVSLPLKDIYAGDWYTQTSGTETSEYFTDLTFDSGTESRSNPLVYQRSWDNSASIVEVTTDEDGNVTNGSGSSINSYSSTGWSSVYNNGAVPYAAGSGFSVKAYTQNSDVDSVLFRFPKSDVSYTTTYTGDLNKENYGRLWVSDYVIERTAENPEEDGSDDIYVKANDTIRVSYSLTNEGYCLVGNPFTANMSMKKFIEVNDSCISAYWMGTSEGPIEGTKDENSEGTDDDYPVPPCGAFYAVVNKDTLASVLQQGSVELKFTKDMQMLDSLETETADLVAFSIRAVSASGRSSASFAYSDKATDGYSVNEDAILLEDDSWKRIGMPLVYTVAGSKAVSVNSLKKQRVIPLGVFADEGSSYTLTFVGVDNVEEPVLYDAELNTETPINEGFTMTLQGATHGRYFIRTAGNATEIQEVTQETPRVVVYSPASRTIVVSADEEIERVEVYGINGSLLKHTRVGGISCTLYDINSDIAIVKVYTEKGEYVSKLKVKS